jgi:hypothetical protein
MALTSALIEIQVPDFDHESELNTIGDRVDQ